MLQVGVNEKRYVGKQTAGLKSIRQATYNIVSHRQLPANGIVIDVNPIFRQKRQRRFFLQTFLYNWHPSNLSLSLSLMKLEHKHEYKNGAGTPTPVFRPNSDHSRHVVSRWKTSPAVLPVKPIWTSFELRQIVNSHRTCCRMYIAMNAVMPLRHEGILAKPEQNRRKHLWCFDNV